MLNRRLVIFAVILLVLLVGHYNYVPFSPDFEATVGEVTDGFKVQISYIIGLYDIGSLFQSMIHDHLLVVHFVRWVAVWPFMKSELLFGKLASLLLIEFAILPLISIIPRRINPVIASIPLLLPLLISGRAVLVAVAIGYVFIYLAGYIKIRLLFILSLLFSNLSSASVLTCILINIFWKRPNYVTRSNIGSRVFAIIVLGLSLVISIAEKRYGFELGASGYEAYSSAYQGNLFWTLVSRATIFVSFANGNYVRGVVYLLAGTYLTYKILTLLRNPESRYIQIVLLCCLPGIFMEGLGVIALFFPCFWLLIGFFTPVKTSDSDFQGNGQQSSQGAIARLR